MHNYSELAVPAINAVAPAPTAAPAVPANRKQTQKWMNVGIIYDPTKVTSTSDAGFCAIGTGTPMDDIEGLRKKTVRGSKEARAVYNSLFDMHKNNIDLLKEAGQSEYIVLGSAIDENVRKDNLVKFLAACGLKDEDIAKATGFAFPENTPVWAIQYHRQKAKAEAESEPRASFILGGTKFNKHE